MKKKHKKAYMLYVEGPCGINNYGVYSSKKKAEKARDKKNAKIKCEWDKINLWVLEIQ